MFPSLFLSHFIGGAVGGTAVILALTIILCAFILEDATTVIVGVLVADGIISIPLAIVSIYIGIIIGDAVLYSVGSLARTHPRLAHYIDHDFTAPFRSWLEKRYALTILSGHFVPGLRFTTYIASGFFRSKLSTYILMAIVGSLIWETILFSAAFWFGSFTSEWIGTARWGLALVFLLIPFFIGRYNLRAYQAKKNGGEE
ncbi:MAG: VTT domain-containing protein [Candidatus Kaiserbacteria bacterium]|nr:VTT domain-containing protein [Candidatus Kaiserbacteria bacterium]